jgi:transposase
MQEVLAVLERAHRGLGPTAISRVTGRGRSTIRRWIETAKELGWSPESMPSEELASLVHAACRPGRPQRPSEVDAQLCAHREQLEQWLRASEPSGRGLTLTKVHELLSRRGVHVPYSSLHRWATRELGFADKRRITVRMADVEPGEVAEVDFGRLGIVPEPETGKRRVVHALIVTLVHSRHQYVHVTSSQTVVDLVDGLEDAWSYFGGVPARVVIDNMRAAVTKADRYEPFFQRTFEEYARHRGFAIDSAIVKHPTGKPHVERSVQYVRENFFRGEEWLDVEHVQREAIRWCTEVAGMRVHGTTRQRPVEVFEAVERPALRPLEAERFDPPSWARCKVHPDHHIIFKKALYSVPTRWVGTEVEVRGDRGLVRIFARGALVKTHPTHPPGGRSTDYDDYPRELAPYAMRDPDRMVKDAKLVGPNAHRFMRSLLGGPLPWAKLRQAQKLLRLASRYGNDVVDRACARSLAFSLVDVRRVESIVLQGLDRVGRPVTPGAGSVVPLTARFLRPAKSFSHSTKPTTTEENVNANGDQTIAARDSETPEAVGHPSDAARSSEPRSQDQDE